MATKTPGIQRLLYDRREAAEQISLSIRSLDYLIAQRLIDVRRIGKKVLIPHAELVRFARGNHTSSVASKSASSNVEPSPQV